MCRSISWMFVYWSPLGKWGRSECAPRFWNIWWASVELKAELEFLFSTCPRRSISESTQATHKT